MIPEDERRPTRNAAATINTTNATSGGGYSTDELLNRHQVRRCCGPVDRPVRPVLRRLKPRGTA